MSERLKWFQTVFHGGTSSFFFPWIFHFHLFSYHKLDCSPKPHVRPDESTVFFGSGFVERVEDLSWFQAAGFHLIFVNYSQPLREFHCHWFFFKQLLGYCSKTKHLCGGYSRYTALLSERHFLHFTLNFISAEPRWTRYTAVRRTCQWRQSCRISTSTYNSDSVRRGVGGGLSECMRALCNAFGSRWWQRFKCDVDFAKTSALPPLQPPPSAPLKKPLQAG